MKRNARQVGHSYPLVAEPTVPQGTSLYPASSPKSQDGVFWMGDQENHPSQPQVCSHKHFFITEPRTGGHGGAPEPSTEGPPAGMMTRTSPGLTGLRRPRFLGARYVSAQHSRGPEAVGHGAGEDREPARAVPGWREGEGSHTAHQPGHGCLRVHVFKARGL